MKKTTLIIAFLALATSAQADYEAITGKRADTIRVTNAADNGEGTLREALSIAKKGAVVLLEKDIVIKPHSGEYIINKPVKIKAQGRGAIINAEGRHRIFRIVKGGALYAEGLTIAGGYAPRGAGVYNEGGFFSARKCHFTKNHGYGNSGGAYSQDGATNGEIFETTFNGNTDATQGGAIYKGGSGNLLIVNTAIFNNNAPLGGGISARGGNLNLLNVTIANNNGTAEGGGIYAGITSGTLIVRSTNAIIAHNISPTGQDIRVTNAATTLLYNHSLVTTAVSQDAGPTVTPGTGNTTASPAFTNVAGNIFTLTALSGAVNTGSTTAYLAVTSGNLDVSGGARIVGGLIDMGAYEFVPPISQAPAMSFWSMLIMALGLGNIALLMLLSGGVIAQIQHIIKGINLATFGVSALTMVTMFVGMSFALEGTILLHDVVGSLLAGILSANTVVMVHRKKAEVQA